GPPRVGAGPPAPPADHVGHLDLALRLGRGRGGGRRGGGGGQPRGGRELGGRGLQGGRLSHLGAGGAGRGGGRLGHLGPGGGGEGGGRGRLGRRVDQPRDGERDPDGQGDHPQR